MEWNNGNGQQQPVNKPAHTTHKKKLSLVSLKTASVVLVFCIAILIVSVAGLVALGSPKSQAKYVDSTKYQAVFLNGGQVYFGKISTINDEFMQVKDIYYLRVNQTVQPDQQSAGEQQAANNDISLVKLGCELHGPQDSMIINQDQIIFWENLKEDGQVAKAVKTYRDQNPNGQNCDAPATNSGTNATPAAGNNP